MPADTIPSTVRHLLEDTYALIHTFGHDNGLRVEGHVPLTLVGAMKLALDYSPHRPVWTLNGRSQVLIDTAFSHLREQFIRQAATRPDYASIMTFRTFLRSASTPMITTLIDDTLAGDV